MRGGWWEVVNISICIICTALGRHQEATPGEQKPPESEYGNLQAGAMVIALAYLEALILNS